MRNDLYGLTEITSSAFPLYDARVNLTRREVAGFEKRGIQKSFVVSDVEIGFGAIFCNEYFTMLQRRHRSGVDIDVGIYLEHSDVKT